MKPLRKIAERLSALADEADAGHMPDPDDIALAERQLAVLREDIAAGLHE